MSSPPMPWYAQALHPNEYQALKAYIAANGKGWRDCLPRDLARYDDHIELQAIQKRLRDRMTAPTPVFKAGDGARYEDDVLGTVAGTVVETLPSKVVLSVDDAIGPFWVPALERDPRKEVTFRPKAGEYVNTEGAKLTFGRRPLSEGPQPTRRRRAG